MLNNVNIFNHLNKIQCAVAIAIQLYNKKWAISKKRYSNSRCQKYVFVYEIFDKRQKRTTLANTKCTLVVCIEEEMISPNYFLLS